MKNHCSDARRFFVWDRLLSALTYFRTSDVARAAGCHPNTVRKYLEWGLLPPVERSPAGYRRFTQRHLDCMRLARLIYAAEYPGRVLRAAGNAVITQAAAEGWAAALERAQAYLAAVQAELDHANRAAALLEHWAQTRSAEDPDPPLSIGETADLLGVSLDIVRNWERSGLIRVPRSPENGYRRFGWPEIERLRVIRLLSRAGYSHMAMLRMFVELDGGKTRGLKTALDTPAPDEDIFSAADHWLTTLNTHERLARQVITMIEALISQA